MSNLTEIAKLHELVKEGILTEAEFNQEKAKLLGMNPIVTENKTEPAVETKMSGISIEEQPREAPKPNKPFAQEILEIKTALKDMRGRMKKEIARLEDSDDDDERERASELSDDVDEIESAIDNLNDTKSC